MEDSSSPKIPSELVKALLDDYRVKVGGTVKKNGTVAGIVTLTSIEFIEPMLNGIQAAMELIKDANPEYEIGVISSENPCLANEVLSFNFYNPADFVEA